ncbi:MAG TPA: hypothetical protein VFX58_13780 [Chitinophagaceae bacterium]|nr:hypothetical protein [Chitinophagaceae bacterium]
MRKNIIRSIFVAAAITGAFLVLGSSRPDSNTNKPCKESMDQCCKKSKSGSDNMIWETLSGQFFTSSSLN